MCEIQSRWMSFSDQRQLYSVRCEVLQQTAELDFSQLPQYNRHLAAGNLNLSQRHQVSDLKHTASRMI